VAHTPAAVEEIEIEVPMVLPSELPEDPSEDSPHVEFRIDSADGCAYSLDEFRTFYGGTAINPPVEWTTSVIVGWGWPCGICGVLNAPADLGCHECNFARTEPPPYFEKNQGKLEAVLMIPQKSIGSLIGKAGAKIRIIRDTSRCYVHVSEERGERRVVTLTGTAKEIATCKELMRVAIDAVDDSMGETIKSEIARRKAALAASGGGRRGDPSLIVTAAPQTPRRLSSGAPAPAPVPATATTNGHHHEPSTDVFGALPSGGAVQPSRQAAVAATTALPPGPSGDTFPEAPASGQQMFMSTSLDAFYRRASATCTTDADRVAMAAEVQIAVVRRGMELLGHTMSTEEIRQMLQSSIEETPVSFQELCDVVKQVAWDSEPVPRISGGAASVVSAPPSTSGYLGPSSPPPALSSVGQPTPFGANCACCTSAWCKSATVWECAVCRAGHSLTFAAADACERSHGSDNVGLVCSACGIRTPRSSFTKGQLGKPAGKQRCRQCVGNGVLSRTQSSETSELPAASSVTLCRACGTPGADKTCTGCSSVKYCNVDCQREDWKSGGHKTECALMQRTPIGGLPAELAHPLHPAHPLVLVLDGEPSDEPCADGVRCNACTELHFGVYYHCQLCHFFMCSRVGCLSGASATSTAPPLPLATNAAPQQPQKVEPPMGAPGSDDAFEITFLQASDFLLNDEMANGVVDAAVGSTVTTAATAAAESVLSSSTPPTLHTPWPDMGSGPSPFGTNGSVDYHGEPPRPAVFSVMRLIEPRVLPALKSRDMAPVELANWSAQVSAVLEQSFSLAVTLWPSTLDKVDREIDAAEVLHRARLEDSSADTRDAALAAIPTLRQLRQLIADARSRWSPKWNEELARFEAELRRMQMDVAKIEAEARSETATVAGLQGALATANAQAVEFEQRMRGECEIVVGASSVHDYDHRLNTLVGMQAILSDAVAASKAAVDHQQNLRATTTRAAAKAKQSALLSDEMSMAAAKLNGLFGSDIVKIGRPSPGSKYYEADSSLVHPNISSGWSQSPSKRPDDRRDSGDDTSDEGAVSDEHDPHSYPLVPASHNRSRFFNATQPIGTPTKPRAPPGRLRNGHGGLQE
jgi:hypothetical protein